LESRELSLTVLGCDGSYPGPGGACSGYLIQHGSSSVWVDTGSGTMANLQKYVSLTEVDAVVISHSHPDHWSDLDLLAVACRRGIDRPPVPVYSPADVPSRVRTRSADEVFDWHLVDDGVKVRIGPIGLTFSRTDHPVPTFAIRFDAGPRSIGYSADTGPDWGLEQLGGGLSLALCEATLAQEEEGTAQHLSARQAGATAARAGVEHLVITHLSPGMDTLAAREAAAAAFGSPVSSAAIGARYTV